MNAEFGGLVPDDWMALNFASLCADVAGLDKYPASEPDGHYTRGIYFLWDINGSLLYVGKTESITSRMWVHLSVRAIPFAAFSYMPVPGRLLAKLYLSEIENCYIAALDPWHNTQRRTPPRDRWAVGLLRMIADRSAQVIAQRRPPLVQVVCVAETPERM